MTSLANLLNIATLLLLIGGIVGGYIVIRSAIAKSESEVQTRVRDALSAENALLRSRVERLEKDNKKLENLIQLFIATLKKTYRIETEIDGDIITMRSSNGTHSTRLSEL